MCFFYKTLPCRGEHFSIELTYNYGVESYKIGDGFNCMGLRLPDIEGIAERAKATGGEVVSGPEVRPPYHTFETPTSHLLPSFFPAFAQKYFF